MPSWLNLINSDDFQSINGRLERIDASESESQNGFALLDSQSILSVKGETASKFLQGQSTADMEALQVGESTLGAICTNKGRVICNFRALKTEDSILLRLSADLAEPTREYLTKFAVFFKAELRVWDALSVAVATSGESISLNSLPANISYTNGEEGSIEFYTEPENAPALFEFLSSQLGQLSESDWYAQQIRSGQTSINICTTEKYLPHQLNLDKSGAVSFTKGCYTGQEIVARTEYKGKTKRRVLPVLLDTDMRDLHDIKLQLDNEAQTEVSLLDAALEADGKTVVSLLLPTDQPEQGAFLVNGQKVSYRLLPLPYSIE